MADPWLGLLQGLNQGVQSYMDRSTRLEELGAKEKKEAEGLLREEQKAKENREFEKQKLKAEYAAKGINIDFDEAGNVVQKGFDPEYEKREIRIAQAKKKAEDGGPGGKTLPAGEASAMGESTSAVKALQDYNKLLSSSSPQATGPGLLKSFSRGIENVKGLIGATPSGLGQELQTIQANKKAAAQVIGRFLEGGKMTDADVNRYASMLPSESDAPQVRAQKEQILGDLIANRQGSIKSSLGAAGYNVGSMPTIERQVPKNVGPKVGQIEGGYEFIGGNPADKRNWRPVR